MYKFHIKGLFLLEGFCFCNNYLSIDGHFPILLMEALLNIELMNGLCQSG